MRKDRKSWDWRVGNSRANLLTWAVTEGVTVTSINLKERRKEETRSKRARVSSAASPTRSARRLRRASPESGVKVLARVLRHNYEGA